MATSFVVVVPYRIKQVVKEVLEQTDAALRPVIFQTPYCARLNESVRVTVNSDIDESNVP